MPTACLRSPKKKAVANTLRNGGIKEQDMLVGTQRDHTEWYKFVQRLSKFPAKLHKKKAFLFSAQKKAPHRLLEKPPPAQSHVTQLTPSALQKGPRRGNVIIVGKKEPQISYRATAGSKLVM